MREYAYQHAGINAKSNVLDVGCGTGIVVDELVHRPVRSIIGLDININSIVFVNEWIPNATGIVGDALRIPFRNHVFDACICHFLLLWVADPLQAVAEMTRVTRKGGFVLILAEPDYGGRIDYPNELSQIGSWQIKSLQAQGANPYIGRSLKSLCKQSHLANIEIGILGGQWRDEDKLEEINLEWQVIKSDLDQIGITDLESDPFMALDMSSRASSQRVLYVPTFYALGQVGD